MSRWRQIQRDFSNSITMDDSWATLGKKMASVFCDVQDVLVVDYLQMAYSTLGIWFSISTITLQDKNFATIATITWYISVLRICECCPMLFQPVAPL